jgi:hypothetical protein
MISEAEQVILVEEKEVLEVPSADGTTKADAEDVAAGKGRAAETARVVLWWWWWLRRWWWSKRR